MMSAVQGLIFFQNEVTEVLDTLIQNIISYIRKPTILSACTSCNCLTSKHSHAFEYLDLNRVATQLKGNDCLALVNTGT